MECKFSWDLNWAQLQEAYVAAYVFSVIDVINMVF
ncbi:hypothetical protein MYO4S_00015 [Serratia phage 4S]|nr:hypothetical protein MYO4S_00015 [Serratia phage 4S]